MREKTFINWKHLFLKYSLVVIVLLLFPTAVYADRSQLKEKLSSIHDKSDIEIEFFFINEQQYVISIASSPINGNSPQTNLQAFKEAEMLANQQLAKYVHGVQSDSIKEINYLQTYKNIDGELKFQEKKKVIEVIKEKGSGILNNTFRVDKWKSGTPKEYYVAIGLEI